MELKYAILTFILLVGGKLLAFYLISRNSTQTKVRKPRSDDPYETIRLKSPNENIIS
jgi:hypothetical protein